MAGFAETPMGRRRQNELQSRMADDFDAVVLHNKVHDDLGEDLQLATLLDANARTHEGLEYREKDLDEPTRTGDLANAAGIISDVADNRAREIVAEACQTVVDDGDEWVEEGHWEREKIDAAQHEAKNWLQAHTNEASRLGLLRERDSE